MSDAPFPAVPDLPQHLEYARHDHAIHYHSHGYIRPAEQSRGRCTWRWDSDGCAIDCWAPDVPGHGLCITHLAAAGVS